MKIALLGNGRMSQTVARRAGVGGHEVGLVLGSESHSLEPGVLADRIHGIDVAIDFSTAAAVVAHTQACAIAGTPLVQGTTAWRADERAVFATITRHGGALVYGANFSIGAFLFHELVAYAGRLFAPHDTFAPYIEEAHHASKRDAPSGTAARLRDELESTLFRPVPVSSTRAGAIPGTHRVGFDSIADQIRIVHEARSREGFADGALLAAEWIAGRSGVYTFADVVGSLVAERRVAS